MRRGKVERNQGQVVNNFFTLVTIVIMTAVITLYVKYIVEPKNEARGNPNLACQKSIYTTQKIANEQLLKQAYGLYSNGEYMVSGGLILSEQLPSKMTKVITVEKSDKLFLDTIKHKQKKDAQRYVKIKYEIIEHDTQASNYKNKEQKLIAGSLLTSFRINGKEAYRMYTDFETANIDAINERIQCTMKAFETNAKI